MQKSAIEVGVLLYHRPRLSAQMTSAANPIDKWFRQPSVKKLGLTMKLLSIFLFLACISASAGGNAQSVSISGKSLTYHQVFIAIKKQTGYVVMYNQKVLPSDKKFDLSVRDILLTELLDLILKDEHLKYHIEHKTIFISKSLGALEFINEGLQALISDTLPRLNVKGRVVSETGGPVHGASVMVKNTSYGTSTSADGYFELKNIEENAILVISAVNLEPNEVKVNGRADLSIIVVKTKIIEEEEVIVKTNYWETKQRYNPGNISKVNGIEIQRSPVSNPIDALQGRVSGLQITPLTGMPGTNMTVRIRGQNSIANGNDPLYIIDGVPFTSSTVSNPNTTAELFTTAGTHPLNVINPNDIESIEILKDADATAIYGSRGANGVILITTKSGKPGTTNVEFTSYTGFGKVTSKMPLLNTSQFLEMRKEGLINSGNWPVNPVLHSYMPELFFWDSTSYTDWQEELLGGTAATTDLQLAFSGGTENLKYRVGGSYHKETLVFPGDNADLRYTGFLNFKTLSSNKKLATTTSVKYSFNKSNLINKDFTTLALTLAPNAPALYTPEGELNWGEDAWNAFTRHPLAFTKTTYEALTKTLISNFSTSYSLKPNLKAIVNLGYTDINNDAINVIPSEFYYPPSRPTSNIYSVFSNSYFKNWVIEPQLTYSRRVNENAFDVLVGGTFLDQKAGTASMSGSGFLTEDLMTNIAAASQVYFQPVTFTHYRYSAIFGRLNYNYANRYIINLTGRRDGSSRFGPNKRFSNFGAIGVAWIFTNENWMKSSGSVLSHGKFRMSYGVTGNDQIVDYQYLETFKLSRAYQGVSGMQPSRLYNPDFAWETNQKLEFGLETEWLNNKIRATLSYYRNRSSNQLVGYPLPPTTGFNTIQSNFPAVVQNSGVEIDVRVHSVTNKLFTITNILNFTIPRNKLVAFPDLQSSPSYANRYIVGEPLSVRKSYKYIEVNAQTGLYEFEDLNDDGVVNTLDREIPVFTGQKFYAGLDNSIRYKNIQIDILLQFVKQYNQTFLVFHSAPGAGGNQSVYVLDRWKEPGDIASVQRYGAGGAIYNNYMDFYRNSDAAVVDASFLSLKNVRCSYNFGPAVTDKLKINAANIFLQGQNLGIITNYSGLHPEVSRGNLPPLRIISAGFSITL